MSVFLAIRLLSSVTAGSRLNGSDLAHQPQQIKTSLVIVRSNSSYLQLSRTWKGVHVSQQRRSVGCFVQPARNYRHLQSCTRFRESDIQVFGTRRGRKGAFLLHTTVAIAVCSNAAPPSFLDLGFVSRLMCRKLPCSCITC
jgi:hypothetical protein